MSQSPAPHSPFYAHLSRLRFIKRWGLMRNAVEEDVAQHSWEVAVLAHALAVISRDVLGNDVDPDSDPLTVSAVNGSAAGVGSPVAGSTGGLFTVNADGTVTFDP